MPFAPTLDFVSELKSAPSLDRVHSLVRRAGESFGYEHFCIAGVPGPLDDMDAHIHLDGWPQGWMSCYLHNQFNRVDPIIANLRTATEPFSWSEVHRPDADPATSRMMEIAKVDWGLAEGLAIPIHTLNGSQATVSFGASNSRVDPAGRAALHLVAIYGHLRARDLRRRHASPVTLESARLTQREIECLQWTAAGKTTWEISVILSISERTVRFHIDAASAKLGTVNRPHAVAEAFRRDLIH